MLLARHRRLLQQRKLLVTAAALVLYLVGLATAFGLRTWLHVRRTGSSGFHGISGRPGSPSWWAGVLFVLALVLGVAAPALALAGVDPAPDGAVADAVAVAGVVLLGLGVVLVLGSQTGMGSSWRIGVDEAERTELVTGGAFSLVRNPIFTGMVVTQAGLSLAVPTAMAAAALGCLVLAVQLQVRRLEEPYLRRVHGAAYRAYATRTGRFLPGIGRLRPDTGPGDGRL